MCIAPNSVRMVDRNTAAVAVKLFFTRHKPNTVINLWRIIGSKQGDPDGHENHQISCFGILNK